MSSRALGGAEREVGTTVTAGSIYVTAGSIYVTVMVALAAIAAWPIYRSGAFVLLVAVSTVVAAAIAGAAHRLRWSGWSTPAVVAGAVVVLGVPLAVPTRLGSVPGFLQGLADLAAGTVFAWKDLVTVGLPVGSYRNLLVPALLVFLVGTCAALRFAWRQGRAATASVAVALGMLSFGLLFGRTTTSAPLQLGPLVLFAPVETVIGIAGILASILWLSWRSHDERVRSFGRAAASRGARRAQHPSRTGRPSRTDLRRAALGAGMLVVAVAVAVAVVPAAAQGRERDVLRAAVGPDLALSRAVSPLVAYRALFADGRADDVVFTVSSPDGGAPVPDRVRLATLDGYDGETFHSTGTGDARFVRVPSQLDAGAGQEVTLAVTVGSLSDVWMPTAGRLARVDFGGPRAAALADRFYYSAASQAGVQTADGGLQSGDAYVLHAVQSTPVDLASLTPPGVGSAITAPPNLRTWVKEHATGSGGAALASLAALLRERGYLSHALTSTPGVVPIWAQSFDGYTFQPSAAGHSLARIDAMFTRLLEREGDPRAAVSGNYVAAIGDDEQFSVAIALIARELGFPARVVVGARLSTAEPDLAVCAGGVCRAQNLAAWTEVQGADGSWAPIDATPQRQLSPSLEVTQQRDPEIVTDVRPDAVADVVPPASPQDDAARTDPAAAGGIDLTWLWSTLRGVGIGLLVLLILLGPFAVVLVAKHLRRRDRREHPDPATRVAGGWEEYLDAAADAARSIPASSTRTEIADAIAGPCAMALATAADRASFSGRTTTPEDAEEFWRTVDAERAAFASGRGIWRRALAAVSLRSFLRVLTPGSAPGRTPPIIERGRRRPTAGARPSI